MVVKRSLALNAVSLIVTLVWQTFKWKRPPLDKLLVLQTIHMTNSWKNNLGIGQAHTSIETTLLRECWIEVHPLSNIEEKENWESFALEYEYLVANSEVPGCKIADDDDEIKGRFIPLSHDLP